MSTENLYNKEAREKVQSMVEDIDFAMMATDLGSKPMSAIPMSTKKVDDEGNIWFLSNRNSDHNKDIVKDKDVQLLYSKPSDMEFLSVFGVAEITTEASVIDTLYGSADNNWFEGKNDPNITAIKFSPKEAYYWDTKSNKYISLFKMAYGTVTGEKTDIGVSGSLKM